MPMKRRPLNRDSLFPYTHRLQPETATLLAVSESFLLSLYNVNNRIGATRSRENNDIFEFDEKKIELI